MRLRGVRIQALNVNNKTIDNLLFDYVEVPEREEEQLEVIPQTTIVEFETPEEITTVPEEVPTKVEEVQLLVEETPKVEEVEVVVKPTEELEIVFERFEEDIELPKEEEVPKVAEVPEKVTLEIVPKEMPTPAAAAAEFEVTPKVPVTTETKVEELPEVVTTSLEVTKTVTKEGAINFLAF